MFWQQRQIMQWAVHDWEFSQNQAFSPHKKDDSGNTVRFFEGIGISEEHALSVFCGICV